MRPRRGGLQPLRPAPHACGPGPILRPSRRAAAQRVAAVAAFHAAVGMASISITRVYSSWITTPADRPTRIGDTKPFCHVAHASVALPGVSIAHIGGDKPLLLCQGACRALFARCSCTPI